MKLLPLLVLQLLIPLSVVGASTGFTLAEEIVQRDKSQTFTFQRTTMVRVVPLGGESFSWPYVYFRSPDLDTSKPLTIVVFPPNTGRPFDRYQTSEDLIIGSFINDTRWYSALSNRVVYMVPVIPRPSVFGDFYTHALSREVLLTHKAPFVRLDLQVLGMADDLRKTLAAEGLRVEPQIGVIGFSAAGQFANRLGVLHPDRVMFVVSGGVCGLPVLPIVDEAGGLGTYPVGVFDVLRLEQCSIDAREVYRVPQFFMIGSQDMNDAVGYRDSFSEQQSSAVREQLGSSVPERWRAVRQRFVGKWGRAEFHEFPVGHRYDERMVKEACEFALRVMENPPNKSLEPTATAVTPAADAPGAPASAVAHH